MDKLRSERYHDKMQYIIHSLALVERLLPDPDEVETNALYYLLLTAIESAMDIIAMMMKDLGRIPKGDRENIITLSDLGMLNDTMAEELALCNGLRNVLVHQYNGIDRSITLEAAPNVVETLEGFVVVVESFLNEIG